MGVPGCTSRKASLSAELQSLCFFGEFWSLKGEMFLCFCPGTLVSHMSLSFALQRGSNLFEVVIGV